MERRRGSGFTLVELLTVMAIMAILYGILLPVAKTMRSAAFQYSASNSVRQLGEASLMYVADNDETFPPAMYMSGSSLQAWFGRVDADHKTDVKASLLASYTGNRTLRDSSFSAKDYLGDHSGFGYNWAYVGSDFGIRLDMIGFPNCMNPAHLSDLRDTSHTITFASSAYYYATWLPMGDGQLYDFGFVSAPHVWAGNPTVDFRFLGTRTVNTITKQVTTDGSAVFVFADGRASNMRQKQVKDTMFDGS